MQQQAVQYGQVLFAGAVLVWLLNTLASIVRGTGNMRAPSLALVATAMLQIALSGALSLGAGPVPALGMVIYGVVTAAAVAFTPWLSAAGRGGK